MARLADLPIANALSVTRIALLPVLLWTAWHGLQNAWLATLALALFTDGMDGIAARRLRQESELGHRLDSWGDAVVYGTFPFCVWWLYPQMVMEEWPWIAIGVAAVTLPPLVGFIKFRRMPSYHTHLSKIAAVAMTGALFALFVFDWRWPMRVCAVFQFVAGLEHIAITLKLREFRSGVPSLHAALKDL